MSLEMLADMLNVPEDDERFLSLVEMSKKLDDDEDEAGEGSLRMAVNAHLRGNTDHEVKFAQSYISEQLRRGNTDCGSRLSNVLEKAKYGETIRWKGEHRQQSFGYAVQLLVLESPVGSVTRDALTAQGRKWGIEFTKAELSKFSKHFGITWPGLKPGRNNSNRNCFLRL